MGWPAVSFCYLLMILVAGAMGWGGWKYVAVMARTCACLFLGIAMGKK